MFAMANAETGDPDHSLMIANSAVKILEGPPLEEVLLTRDEMSNLVWGVERVVPLPSGEGAPGSEAAAEMLAYHKRWFPDAPPVTWRADRRYELMNTVPENWIPFLPARSSVQSRAIRLQRAVMLRALDGDPLGPQRIRPRTSLLREGLDAAQPYFIFEEEAPRAGARITKAFRRTRARDGRVITWLAALKTAGRGGGSAGLAFDHMRPTTT